MAKTVNVPTGVKYLDLDKDAAGNPAPDGAFTPGIDSIFDSGVRGPQFYALNGKWAKVMPGADSPVEDDALADHIATLAKVTAKAAPKTGTGTGGSTS